MLLDRFQTYIFCIFLEGNYNSGGWRSISTGASDPTKGWVITSSEANQGYKDDASVSKASGTYALANLTNWNNAFNKQTEFRVTVTDKNENVGTVQVYATKSTVDLGRPKIITPALAVLDNVAQRPSVLLPFSWGLM